MHCVVADKDKTEVFASVRPTLLLRYHLFRTFEDLFNSESEYEKGGESCFF